MTETFSESSDQLFDDWISRREQGLSVESFDDLLALHPDRQERLRELYEDWQETERAAAMLRGEFFFDRDSKAPSSFVVEHEKTIDRYQIGDEIGRGGMGVVYRAWDKDVRRYVAMKVTRTSEMASSAISRTHERFRSEAQITGQLDHPGIVSIHDIGQDEAGDLFFTMNLVKGSGLNDIFTLVGESKLGWTLTRAITVIQRICETLAYAHTKGVIHRDLKPSNVMVGRFGEAYVMDWGLAKALDQRDGTSGSGLVQVEPSDDSKGPLTLDGVVLGTPLYMPPEQAEGRGFSAGPQADIYAVGAILYELMAGHPPYRDLPASSGTKEVLSLIRTRPPTPLIDRTANLPGELIAICEKAMARKPEDRYAHMATMADDLRSWSEGRVVSVYRTGVLMECRKWIGRNRLTSAIAGLSSLLLAATLVTFSIMQWQSGRALEKKNSALESSRAAESREREKARLKSESLEKVMSRLTAMYELSSPNRAQGRDISPQDMLDSAAAGLESDLANDPLARSRMSLALGRLYHELGEISKGEKLLKAAIRTLEESGIDDPSISTDGRIRLSELLSDQGHFEAANSILDELESILGADPSPADRAHHEAAKARVSMARGRFDEAEGLMLRALERITEDAPELEESIAHDLALLYGRTDRREKALGYLTDVHERRVTRLGVDHPSTLSALHNLAGALIENTRVEEGLAKRREVVERRTEVLGPYHGATINSMSALGSTLQALGKLDEAVQVFEQANEAAKRGLRPDNLYALDIRRHLGGLHVMFGRWEDAVRLLETDLADRRRILGDEHPDVIPTRDHLANAYAGQRRFDLAIAQLEEALRIQRKRGDREVGALASLLVNLASMYRYSNEPQKSELLVSEAVERATETLGPEAPLTLRAMVELAKVYEDLGRLEEATSSYEEIVDLARDYLHRGHPIRNQALYAAALRFEQEGDIDLALEFVQELLETTSERRFGYQRYVDLERRLSGSN